MQEWAQFTKRRFFHRAEQRERLLEIGGHGNDPSREWARPGVTGAGFDLIEVFVTLSCGQGDLLDDTEDS